MSAPAPCHVGVDYFPEHWPEARWAEDVRLMGEAGMRVVRIAEFTWSKTQPRYGVWDWAWLDRAVETIAGAGLKVILCTPTACPPPWMVQEYPDILPVTAGRGPMTLGQRRHYSPLHAGYREACREIAEQIALRYGAHPAVIGFQIDNELHGTIEDVGPLAQAAFHRWLKARHGTLEALDRNLGLVFWSQQYSNWSQIPVPATASHHPGLRAEWCRFVSQAWTAFCRVQADAMRPHIGGRVLTTNCYLHRWGMEIDWHELMRDGGLDLFAFDNYSNALHENGYYNDLARSLSTPHWILEQRCGDTQHHHIWPEPEVPLETMTEAAARAGAKVITYFRWRQGLFGHEQDHGAVLDHHGRPGAMYRRVSDAIARVAAAEPIAPPRPQTGIVFTWPDAWLSSSSPNSLHYRDLILESVYRGVFEREGAARFVLEPGQLAGLRTVLVPGKLIHDPDWERALIDFARGGGTLVAFPMLFAKDAFNKYRPEYLTPALRELFGIAIERRILVREGHAVSAELGDIRVSLHTRVEELVPVAAEVRGRFSDGPLAGLPWITRRPAGEGTAVYVAGYPDATGNDALLTRLAAGGA